MLVSCLCGQLDEAHDEAPIDFSPSGNECPLRLRHFHGFPWESRRRSKRRPWCQDLLRCSCKMGDSCRFSALKIDVRWQIRSIDMERHESWWVIMSHHESSWTYDIYLCYFVCIIYNCILWYCTSRFSKAHQVAPLGQPWARCARVLGLGTARHNRCNGQSIHLWANSETNWRKLLLFWKSGKWMMTMMMMILWRNHDKPIDYGYGEGSNCWLFCLTSPLDGVNPNLAASLQVQKASCSKQGCLAIVQGTRNTCRGRKQFCYVLVYFGVFGPSQTFSVTPCSCL